MYFDTIIDIHLLLLNSLRYDVFQNIANFKLSYSDINFRAFKLSFLFFTVNFLMFSKPYLGCLIENQLEYHCDINLLHNL